MLAIVFGTRLISLGAAMGDEELTVTFRPIAIPEVRDVLDHGIVGRVGPLIMVARQTTDPVGKLALWNLDQPNPMNGAWAEVDGGKNLQWSATAADQDSLICAGGTTGGQSVGWVTRWRLVSGELQRETLLDLPLPLVGAGAIVDGDTLYVFGGRTADRSFSDAIWTLNLRVPGSAWQRGGRLLQGGVFRPLLARQADVIIVAGGWSQTATANYQWSRGVSLARPSGAAPRQWRAASAMPVDAPAAAALPMGQSHVGFLVGSTAEGDEFSSQAPRTGRSSLLIYNVVTDAWSRREAASAGPLDLVWTGPDGQRRGLLIRNHRASVAEIQLPMTKLTLAPFDYAVIGAFFAFILSVGLWFSRKQTTEAVFALGGRRLPWWVSGISMFATFTSAISFMAIPATAYLSSLIYLFPAIMLVPAFLIQGYVIYPLLRKLEITSTFEYLERRFSRALRMLASLKAIIFQTFGKSTVVLLLPAMAIAATTGIPVQQSILLMGGCTIFAATIGGLQAVAWSEAFVGILMMVAPVIMIVAAVLALPGGAHEFMATARQYDKLELVSANWSWTIPAAWVLCLNSLFSQTILQAADQPVIQRVFSTPLAQVRKTAAMSGMLGLGISILINVLGVVLFTYFHRFPEQLEPTSQNDQLVPLFILHGLPAGVAGLVLAAVLMASMSAVSSAMHSSATLVVEDFYRLWRRPRSDREPVWVMKAGVLVLGGISVWSALELAKLSVPSLYALWSELLGLLGGGFVGVFALGMFTTRANSRGALAGVVASVVVGLGVKLGTHITPFAYIPIVITVCVVVGYLVSLVTPAEDRDLSGLTVFTPRAQ
jgi:SSS family transporter